MEAQWLPKSTLEAVGGALARQELAEGPKGQKKDAKNDPRPAQERQEAILDRFEGPKEHFQGGVGGMRAARKSLSWRI